jgi:hypothetical protein
VDAIDAMLRELHGLGARLVSEIRASDDASAARAHELLRHRDMPPPEDADTPTTETYPM